MERLTYRDAEGHARWRAELMEDDTGEAGELIRNKMAELDDIVENCDISRIRELVEADRDGRCVVLPCKIGTPVYRILWHCGCAAMDDESYKYVGFPVPFTFDMINQFGKSVFLASEEAEEAMKEREEDEG